MPENEAHARIKLNKLLEEAGWRFFPEDGKPANIRLEHGVSLKAVDLESLGSNFEGTRNGFVDFLLLDRKGFPLIVLEAKAESKNPLVGKEQARKYARRLNCRFVILSNGNAHYFWDLERGNPHMITTFPNPDSVVGYQKVTPSPDRLVSENVEADYVVLTQRPGYKAEAAWRNESERSSFIQANALRFLRPYQLKAVHRIQQAVASNQDRFLFEMATGTGKTLTAAAVIKLFLRTKNASRVLFLVDRLELEDQAKKALTRTLSADFQTVIYKETRDDWRQAEIVVTTVQSLLFDNKYRRLFSPTDFDLVISDEAHRSISGNARAVFEYFVGYKLGLTATPRDYLKHFQDEGPTTSDPRESERRQLLDTYKTFGCESGQPTFRYSLLDGVKDGYLVNPTVVDARTQVTTQLLSDQGFIVRITDEAGEDHEQAFKQREFEKRFFSDATNQLFCKVFLENALRDPISSEIGKSIVFSVSQNHAAKLTQILNEMADRMFPGRYQSDFAVQVTSSVPDAQQFAVNFTNNNLLGSGTFIPGYRTSKARVCVTVGMMTTGYDCTDLLNLGLFRPIFSPTDFIQIKGRGTRRHDFLEHLFDDTIRAGIEEANKVTFKLFDFFANCAYFETDYNYDEVLKLPKAAPRAVSDPGGGAIIVDLGPYEYAGPDLISTMQEEAIGHEGMRIDRMFFEKFEDAVRTDPTVAEAVENERWDHAVDYVQRELLNRPAEYFTLDKLRKAAGADRRLTLREILEKTFGRIARFKTKDELLEEEFGKLIADLKPEEAESIPAMKHYFKAYLTSDRLRSIVDSRSFTELATYPAFSLRDYRAVPHQYRSAIPDYVKDYVPLNQFTA